MESKSVSQSVVSRKKIKIHNEENIFENFKYGC